jgi:hypothetical protein
VRSVGGILGLRVFTVTVTRRSWGQRPGIGQSVDQTEGLYNQAPDGTLYPCLVEQMSRSEVIASGGKYLDQDLKVGPVTPTYKASIFGKGGGADDRTLNQAPNANNYTEIIWVVRSTNGTFGVPLGGAVFDMVGEQADWNNYYVILRSTGRSVPGDLKLPPPGPRPPC